MKDLIFVSVAFGPLYLEQQDRLKQSILDIYPDANLLFFRDCLPKESKPFLDSLYGFKVHAIQEAIDLGFKKILWLDPAMILCREIGDTFDKYHVCAVKDVTALHKVSSKTYLNVYGIDRHDLKDWGWHLVGGSLYYFDFNSTQANIIFQGWFNDEKDRLFGSQQQEASEQLQGHRADETCMAMNMYCNGVRPVDPVDVGYCVEENAIFRKLHFK